MKKFAKEQSFVVKGVAIMLLLFYHLFHEKEVLAEQQVNYAPLSENIFLQLAGFGNICVAVFVFLTAYGISLDVLRVDEFSIKDIYIKSAGRFFRLMLNFFLVYVTINLLCVGYMNYGSFYGSGKQGLLQLFCDSIGFSAILGTPMLNGTWWYMKIAYVLIFLVPLLAMVVKKTGKTALLLGFFLPFVIQMDFEVERYFFVAVLGVVAASENWVEKLMNLKIHPVVWWLVAVLGGALSCLIRQNAVVKEYYCNYVDAIVALFIVCSTVMTLGRVPIVNSILKFLGKHSMNIFLAHTFFYLIVWRKYVYYFKYAIVTFIILLGCSLAYSVILEFAKEGGKKFLKIFKKR